MMDPNRPVSPASTQHKHQTLGWAVGVCGVLVGLVALWGGKTSRPQVDFNMVPLVTGEEPIGQLFVRAGCVVCHQIPGIPGADGQVGPALRLGTTGAVRLADPQYRGQALTVREYILESIMAPGIYVVPGFPADTMPVWYGRKLSAGALEKIATYLEQLR